MISAEDINKLRTYRGQPWVAIFREIDESEHIESMRQILIGKKAAGSITIRDLAITYVEYGCDGIAGKTFFRFIEGPVIKRGTYDRLLERGLKWSEVVAEAAREAQHAVNL